VPLHTLFALILSALVGVSLGLLGGGGSILAVPLLVYVAQLDVRVSVAMSLAVVGATALVASLAHARRGRVEWRAAALFGISGMIGASLGARLTPLVAPRVLLLLFALLMLAVGGLMVRGRRAAGGVIPPGPAAVGPVLAAGLAVGVLTGFLGVGGGFLIVPALTLFAHLPIHVAVGTSLLVIAANSAAGLVSHLGQESVPAGLTLAFTAVAVLGALAGERLASRTSPERLRRAFGVFVVLVGLALAAANLR
jgi:uncharacterized membrane protein YfcA